MRKLWFGFAVVVLALPPLLAAQDNVVLDAKTADAHLVHKVDAVYPASARAAGISGEVRVRASIDATGHVTKAEALSGPLQLQQAAVDAVRQWVYTPFEVNDVAAPAVAEISVVFTGPTESAENAAVAKQFTPQFDACRAAMASHNDGDAAAACTAAAAIADKFAPDTRFIERRSAYVFASAALLRARNFADAERMAQKAVAVVKLGHDDDSGAGAAYAVLGNAEGLNGQLEAANHDLETAETYEKAALNSPAPAATGAEHRSTLKTVLLFHAEVLKRLGRPADAQEKLNEAAAL